MELQEPDTPRDAISISGDPFDDQVRARINGIVMTQVDAALMSTIDRHAVAYAHQAVQQRLASLPPTVVDKVAEIVDLRGLEAAVRQLVDLRVDQILRAAGLETNDGSTADRSMHRAQQTVTGPVQGAKAVKFEGRFPPRREEPTDHGNE